MPSVAPPLSASTQAQLLDLGRQLRARRKALGVTATAAAEAAGMSRVTLHRIERGEPSVTIGACLNVAHVLGLALSLADPLATVPQAELKAREGWIPVRVRLADYPQLKQLAWQVQGADTLTPVEAFTIYERNQRHLDREALDTRERDLLNALQAAFGEQRSSTTDV